MNLFFIFEVHNLLYPQKLIVMEWSRTENPFLNATRNNYSLADEVGQDMYDRLSTAEDPEVQAIGQAIKIPVRNYSEKFDVYFKQTWIESVADTRERRAAMNIVQERMEGWEKHLWVMLNGAQQMDLYARLFPEGNYGQYTRGSIKERVDKFEQFARLVSTITLPAAAPLKAEVEGVLETIGSSISGKRQSNRDDEAFSADLELARQQMCIALYRALGRLIDKFAENPRLIEAYVPVNLLTRSQQLEFTSNKLKLAGSDLIFTRTYPDIAEIRLRNLGITELQVFRTERKGGAPGEATVMLGPGEERIVPVSALGTGRYYYVRNQSATQEGAYNILIL